VLFRRRCDSDASDEFSFCFISACFFCFFLFLFLSFFFLLRTNARRSSSHLYVRSLRTGIYSRARFSAASAHGDAARPVHTLDHHPLHHLLLTQGLCAFAVLICVSVALRSGCVAQRIESNEWTQTARKVEAHRLKIVFGLVGLKAAELHGDLKQVRVLVDCRQRSNVTLLF
jgi:hypothetical protein